MDAREKLAEDVRLKLAGPGYVIVTGAEAGLPREGEVITALSPALNPDVQKGKLHAQWTAPWLEVAGIMRYGVQFDYFRNYDGVILIPHRGNHDGIGIVWCLGRVCDGGVFYLCTDQAGQNVVMQRSMKPGEVLIFDDTRFWHGVTEVKTGWRDVLVINQARSSVTDLALEGWRRNLTGG